jgi:hypothetical protein
MKKFIFKIKFYLWVIYFDLRDLFLEGKYRGVKITGK